MGAPNFMTAAPFPAFGGSMRPWTKFFIVLCHPMLRCKEKALLIARIEEEIGWRKLWGDLLDYRKITTVGLQSLSRIMSHQGSNPCTD